MSRIEHPYQEISKVLAGYNTPVHKNDEKLLMKLYHLPGQQLEDVLSEFYVLIRSRIETFLRAEYSFKKVMAHIENKKTGEIVFSSEVEFPEFWSMQSITVFASKYLIRNVETSIVSAISRVVAWVAINGYRDGHLAFNSEDLSECNAVSLSAFDYGKFSIDDFAYALSEIIIEQRGTFNSPVWFNVGNSENPMTDCHQVSACFVTSVKDNMGSIIAQNVVNQMIALGGSGSGCDMTPIRSRKEWIGKQQGRPSGPIGFTGMFDAVLQATRSAGRFRRAAGLVSLKQHHPDIIEYIRFKANEEKKGRTLSTSMSEWDHEFASESQFSIFGTLRVQNINTAVRLTREFWDCYKDVDSEYPIRDRNGDKIGTLGCEELLYEIARAQLECGDPGIQYDDNINAWNPFLAMGLRFNSSNACSEVQYLDNSACNLASLRITAYYDSQKNTFNSINLYEDISIMLMAQDILIDFSYYPTEDIAKTSYNTRNLGLNYGDLGGLLYMMGLPYDSDEARCVAAVITSYFTACAHTASMDMALTLGSFKYLEEDIGDLKHHMKSVLSNHYSMHGCLFDKPQNIDLVNSCDNTSFNAYKAITNIIMDNKNIPSFIRDMQTSSVNKYEYILNSDEADFKLRNATVTVFVPQGTVGLTLGNLTSGIEPFLSHSFGKDLVGGGNMRFITGDDIHHIARVNCNRIYGDSYEMINRLNETAIGTNGKNILSSMAHIMMMASVQPFISLAISKTCNMPSDTTVNQIIQLYKDAHKYGLKAVTIYVDGSKVLQPLKTEKKLSDSPQDVIKGDETVLTGGLEALNDSYDVDLKGWAVQIGGEKFYVKFGWHPDVHNMLWEVWAEQSFCGGTVDGMAKTLAVMASRRFQESIRNGNYDSVKSEIIKTWARMTFPPNGLVVWPKGQPEYFNNINTAQSFPNLLAQMIASLDVYPGKNALTKNETHNADNSKFTDLLYANVKIPICRECGRQMIKSGGSSKCFTCLCGASVGGCG